MSRRIDPAVLAVIERADTSGNALRITGQLDRKTYAAVNGVLEAAGGRWDRKAKAHLFGCEADDALEQILLTGEVLTKKTQQQEFGFFETPVETGRLAVEAADVRPGMLVREPSAGHGALARLLRAAGATVHCTEILPENVRELIAQGFEVEEADFLAVAPTPIYDRVVMNPPFAKQADIKHVTHALKFLKPGGRLASIMSSGPTFRTDRRTVEFNALIRSLGGTVEPLPEASFKASGTLVNTILVTAEVAS
ncbi:restriction endonuclease subunit M [Variovorax paradoxus]|jgi:predicted RNA methylase|uniref:methyltransferase n=1 Tax=Variovorax paradoxus TaxID=34073 RepID=UPI0006E6D53E|nr:restriction endonuclease subunit M [Variovorax paradoxus]KPV00499.1 restriction endonuclease subunit M [Variovorax paradoxus]KPV08125.1 restriction endonuclease subunit M [Variovorax paradoxus]KPV22540.1 restriction endonuclease subunit M [Variovorax paradoxus]KPV35455.1 restriction endonuclease subunit M [Variovorax paradoxus]